MKFTKESILKSLNSLTMPAWIKRVFRLIVDYIDDAASSIDSKADLVDGKVPIEQLPSYVDDVVEFQSIISYSGLKRTIGNAAYKDKLFFVSTDPYKNKFVNTKDNTAESDWEIIDPEDGKIYINITDNHSYRWTGSTLLDLDKDFSNGINTLNNIVKVAYIGIVNNLDDIAEGDQTGLNQTGMGQLFSFLFNYKSYRNSYIEFENEDIDSRLCRIIDINGGKRQFTIYNNGALQTYKQLNTGGKYSLEKISDIPGYIYFDYNDASSNKIAANSLKTNKAVPALLAVNEYVFIGYCTKINEGTTAFIVFNKQTMETYSMDNLAGTFIFINKIDTDTIVNYDSIRGSKTNAEAKQELINILAGDTVVLDYNNAGQVLDNNTINALKKDNSIILLNDNTSIESSKSIYTVVTKTNAYLYFCTAKHLASNGGSLTYNELTINLANSSWNIYPRNFIFPYGAFLAEGYTGKSQAQVNKEIANVSLLNFYKITNSDLNKVHSGDKLENIKNATFLILDEGAGKTRIFIRGYSSDATIYYSCLESNVSTKYITLELPSNLLKSIRNSPLDDIMFNNYSTNGGTKINKKSMYKELAAQLTVNTYVINSSILNTTITDTNIREGISKADILIIEDSTNNSYKVCIRGFVSSNMIYFFNLQNANADNITATRVSFNTTTNLLSSNDVYLQSAFNAYKLGGGTKYTTESAFNTQFAKVIDMTVTQ